MLFLSSGTVLQKYGTREIRKVNDLLRILPVTGPVFLVGLIAIGGTPPFSVFASEFNVLAAVFQSGRPWLGALVAVLLALVFAGIIYALFKMFFAGSQPAAEPAEAAEPAVPGTEPAAAGVQPGEENRAGAVVLIVLLIAAAGLGLFLPAGLKELLDGARQIIYGG